jgi:hypothetical protein
LIDNRIAAEERPRRWVVTAQERDLTRAAARPVLQPPSLPPNAEADGSSPMSAFPICPPHLVDEGITSRVEGIFLSQGNGAPA